MSDRLGEGRRAREARAQGMAAGTGIYTGRLADKAASSAMRCDRCNVDGDVGHVDLVRHEIHLSCRHCGASWVADKPQDKPPVTVVRDSDDDIIDITDDSGFETLTSAALLEKALQLVHRQGAGPDARAVLIEASGAQAGLLARAATRAAALLEAMPDHHGASQAADLLRDSARQISLRQMRTTRASTGLPPVRIPRG